MPRTKQLMVELSAMPCSVIIIGLGEEAEFDNMYQLDGDSPNRLHDDQGRPVLRDIVQFVEFVNAVKNGDLAEQVLKEIPTQFLGFM